MLALVKFANRIFLCVERPGLQNKYFFLPPCLPFKNKTPNPIPFIFAALFKARGGWRSGSGAEFPWPVAILDLMADWLPVIQLPLIYSFPINLNKSLAMVTPDSVWHHARGLSALPVQLSGFLVCFSWGGMDGESWLGQIFLHWKIPSLQSTEGERISILWIFKCGRWSSCNL